MGDFKTDVIQRNFGDVSSQSNFKMSEIVLPKQNTRTK